MWTFAPTDERCERLLPIHVITAGTDHNQEDRNRPRGAVFHHVFFVEKGSLIFETPSGRFRVEEGTALFLEKDQPMHYRAEKQPCRTGWVAFDGPGAENLLSYFRAKNLEARPTKELSPLPEEFCRQIRQKASAARLSEELYRLLQRFFEAKTANSHPYVQQAKQYLQQNYHLDVSVAELAEAVNVSPSFLFRKFREDGTTPVEYLRRVRMEKAKTKLLEVPDRAVAQIARECGFSDCSYFCKTFRQTVGISPGKFREQYRW